MYVIKKHCNFSVLPIKEVILRNKSDFFFQNILSGFTVINHIGFFTERPKLIINSTLFHLSFDIMSHFLKNWLSSSRMEDPL